MSERRLHNRSNLPFRQRLNNQYGSKYYRSRQSNAIRENDRNYGSRSDYDRSNNRINRHGGIGTGSKRYSSHREYSMQVDNRNVTRIEFPLHVNTSNIIDILQDLESDHIQSLAPRVAIALLHKIGKCKCNTKIKSFDLSKSVIKSEEKWNKKEKRNKKGKVQQKTEDKEKMKTKQFLTWNTKS